MGKPAEGGTPIYTLPYGDRTVSFTLPSELDPIVVSYAGDGLLETDDPVGRALREPIASPPLSTLAHGKKQAVLLISDGTRLCPSDVLLPPLLAELNAGGIPDARIRIIVALGLHRVHTPQELAALVGEDVYRRVDVRNHSALEEDCVYLGDTQRGTPVAINRHVVEADLRIAVGNVEPHRLVGISGGIKAVIPGCASKRCIEANHALSRQHKAVPGVPDNPVHEDLEEAQRLVPLDFIMNVVVNHKREILAAAAGSPIPAHRSLVEQARAAFLVDVPSQDGDSGFDLVIASAGGKPKDLQLYQAVKSLQNADTLLGEDGGAIVLAAECGEYYGNGTMQLWAETIGDPERILAKLEQEFVLGAHKLQHLYRITGKRRVWLQSAMPEPLLTLLGFQKASSTLQATLDEALADVKSRVGDRSPRVAVVPYGALTFPRL